MLKRDGLCKVDMRLNGGELEEGYCFNYLGSIISTVNRKVETEMKEVGKVHGGLRKIHKHKIGYVRVRRGKK